MYIKPVKLIIVSVDITIGGQKQHYSRMSTITILKRIKDKEISEAKDNNIQ